LSVSNVLKVGNECLKDREDIPGAPLWHMGKVAILESKNSFDLLQNTIAYLTCKGKLNKPFSDNEKEFMKELFEAMWWGGQYHGYYEAAKLANHYVNGDGKPLPINPEIYKHSIIVTDTMAALKNHLKDKASKNKVIAFTKTGDLDFLHSDHARSLKRERRSPSRQGYIFFDGALLSEQSNLRLKNADNRFHLQANTSKGRNNYFMTRWSVTSIYDFEPFSKNHITDVPLAKGFILKLPDGLLHHLTKIGVAKDFKYTASWQERWA
jgi:hypothetical protein